MFQTIDANCDLSLMLDKYKEQEDFIMGKAAAHSSWSCLELRNNMSPAQPNINWTK